MNNVYWFYIIFGVLLRGVKRVMNSNQLSILPINFNSLLSENFDSNYAVRFCIIVAASGLFSKTIEIFCSFRNHEFLRSCIMILILQAT